MRSRTATSGCTSSRRSRCPSGGRRRNMASTTASNRCAASRSPWSQAEWAAAKIISDSRRRPPGRPPRVGVPESACALFTAETFAVTGCFKAAVLGADAGCVCSSPVDRALGPRSCSGDTVRTSMPAAGWRAAFVDASRRKAGGESFIVSPTLMHRDAAQGVVCNCETYRRQWRKVVIAMAAVSCRRIPRASRNRWWRDDVASIDALWSGRAIDDCIVSFRAMPHVSATL